ncbi:MAG TPA: ATP-binding protein [Planctomycetota bacterium]|jgi:anti-sigma regulatory factor (Ser/Thr protein kinase)|nr:ATP-binding protein [Planctomycetota bacterium]
MIKTVQKTVGMPAHPRHLNEVRHLIEETLREAGVPKRTADLLVLAVDEAMSSIVHYAKFKGQETEITLSVDVDDVRFKARIVDATNVFDLDRAIADAVRPEAIERERAYGLGVFLMRQIFDEILYTYRKGFENELVLIRFLE